MRFGVPITKVLFRKSINGKINYWYAFQPTHDNYYIVNYGILNGANHSITRENPNRQAIDCITTEYNEKHKQGYKYITELKDNVDLPVKGDLTALYNYLNTYLPIERTNANNEKLSMLAKAYDNTNNKVFKKVPSYIGQYKINGLRCNITAYKEEGLFSNIRLKFTSREGIVWTSLGRLEKYLLSIFSEEVIDALLYKDYALDGEVYLPNNDVNFINSFVKNETLPQNALIQFWCYDVMTDELNQAERIRFLYDNFSKYVINFKSKDEHLNNKERFVLLPTYESIFNDEVATICRNHFIDLGFEGLILRNPSAYYAFGSRKANVMIKYKRHTDGKFIIKDIRPEGVLRVNIPLFECINDINDATFSVHISEPIEIQEQMLKDKDKYIGKTLFIEYGERSGISQVPFHVKKVKLLI